MKILTAEASDFFQRNEASVESASEGSSQSQTNPADAPDIDEIGILPKRAKSSIFDDLFDMDMQSEPAHVIAKSITEEINEYLKAQIVDKSTNALLFWRVNKNSYPILGKLAKTYLSAPASSGSVERMFSLAGSIGRARRNRISVTTLEKLLMFKEWRLRK